MTETNDRKEGQLPIGIGIIEGSYQIGGVTHHLNGWVREDGKPSGPYTAYGQFLAGPHRPPIKGFPLRSPEFALIFQAGWPKDWDAIRFVTTKYGDYGSYKVTYDFGDGVICETGDSWTVVNEDPVSTLHAKHGSLPDLGIEVQLPLVRENSVFEWGKENLGNGLYKSTGSCLLNATRADGKGLAKIKISYVATHTALSPEIPLPSLVKGSRQIFEYDEISGMWKGEGTRTCS